LRYKFVGLQRVGLELLVINVQVRQFLSRLRERPENILVTLSGAKRLLFGGAPARALK
jgi:hypothetical protein